MRYKKRVKVVVVTTMMEGGRRGKRTDEGGLIWGDPEGILVLGWLCGFGSASPTNSERTSRKESRVKCVHEANKPPL